MRIIRYLPALILAVLLATSCGADKNLKRGEKYLALGEYYDAATEYKTAYSKTPSKEREKRGKIAKKMAFCLFLRLRAFTFPVCMSFSTS